MNGNVSKQQCFDLLVIFIAFCFLGSSTILISSVSTTKYIISYEFTAHSSSVRENVCNNSINLSRILNLKNVKKT